MRLLSFFAVLTLVVFGFDTYAQKYDWALPISASQTAYCQDLAIDEYGNSFVTGFYFGTIDFDPGPATLGATSKGNSDLFFAKYDKNGNLKWGKSIGGSLADISYSIAIDVFGNVLLTGNFSDSADFDPGTGVHMLYSKGTSDMFFAKYDTNGNLLWAYNFGSESLSESCNGISSDSYGNIFIVGSVLDTVDFDPGAGVAYNNYPNSKSIFIAKYDSNGNFIWTLSFDQPISGVVNEIVVDNSNNFSITGYYQSTCDFDPGAGVATLPMQGSKSVFTAKYDNDGNYIWAKSISGTLSSNEGMDVAVDNDGNVFTVGYFDKSNVDFDSGPGVYNLNVVGSADAFVVKYDVNGNFQWANSTGSTSQDDAYSVAVDDSGSVYVTGVFWSTTDFDPSADTANLTSVGFRDIYFVKYNTNGDYEWAKSIGSGYDDRGKGIAVDENLNVYLAGYYQGTADFDPGMGTAILQTNGSYNVFVAKYKYDNCKTISSFSASGLTACIDDSIVLTNSSTSAVDFEWLVDGNLYSNALDTSIMLASAGTYTISLIAKNGICIDSSGVNITVLPKYNELDTIIEICAGDSILIYGNYHSVAGTYYQTLASVDFCDSVVSTILIVNDADVVALFSTSSYMICEGDTLQFINLSNDAVEYSWLENGIQFSSTENPSKIFNYVDTVSISLIVSNGACSDSVGVEIIVNPVYNYMSDTASICNGDSVLIYGVYRYSSGVYSQSFSSINFCDSVVSILLNVHSVDTSVSVIGNSFVSNQTLATYQWVDCFNSSNDLSSEINQSFVPTENGSYAVIVNINGCIDTSSCYEVNITGVQALNNTNIVNIYPNPSTGRFYLQDAVVDADYEVLNVHAKVLKHGQLQKSNLLIDLTDLPSGVYFVKVGMSYYKLLKN